MLSLARDVRRLSASGKGALRRKSFLIECGGVLAPFDVQPQPLPISAAAMLSGVYGFLSEIPELSKRRHVVQRRRRVNDREILSRFGNLWLAPSGARLQAVHEELHRLLVEEFGLAGDTQPRGGAASPR